MNFIKAVVNAVIRVVTNFTPEKNLPWIQLAAAKSLQSCPTLCNPTDSSPPGSPVPGILQARTLEWVAISFSNAWKWKVKVKSLSRVRLFATPWTADYQAPPSMGFSRQEYWSGVPLPSPDSAQLTWKVCSTCCLWALKRHEPAVICHPGPPPLSNTEALRQGHPGRFLDLIKP